MNDLPVVDLRWLQVAYNGHLHTAQPGDVTPIFCHKHDRLTDYHQDRIRGLLDDKALVVDGTAVLITSAGLGELRGWSEADLDWADR